MNYPSSILLYIIKAAKASKDAINTEVQQLLLLKASYKKLAGHDYQPPTSSATSSALPTPTTTTTITTTSTGSSISGFTKTTKESSSSSKSNMDSHKPTTTPITATTNSIASSTVSLVNNPLEGLMNDPDSYVLIIIHTIDNTSNNNNNQANIIEQQDITRCILVASLYNINLHIINRDDSIYKATVDKLSIIPLYPVLLHNKHMIFTATAICRYISALKSNSSNSSSSSDHNMVDRYLDWYDYSLVPSYSKIIMTRTTIDTASQGR